MKKVLALCLKDLARYELLVVTWIVALLIEAIAYGIIPSFDAMKGVFFYTGYGNGAISLLTLSKLLLLFFAVVPLLTREDTPLDHRSFVLTRPIAAGELASAKILLIFVIGALIPALFSTLTLWYLGWQVALLPGTMVKLLFAYSAGSFFVSAIACALRSFGSIWMVPIFHGLFKMSVSKTPTLFGVEPTALQSSADLGGGFTVIPLLVASCAMIYLVFRAKSCPPDYVTGMVAIILSIWFLN